MLPVCVLRKHPGGKDNYADERLAAEQMLAVVPDARTAAWANRRFLARAVRFLVQDAGIGQFIDVGCGLPAPGNIHQVARELDLGARVAYVDHDRCKSGCSHSGTAVVVRCCGAPVPGCPSPDAAANNV